MLSTNYLNKVGGQIVQVTKRVSDDILADLNRYSSSQAELTRSLSIASSSISILAGLMGIYFFLAIDYRKRVFRHQLIIFLILYDFIKALFLLMYPARVIAMASVYYDIKFCRVVGFFTAFSIEGSDIAILSFAIHLALLIYLPNKKVKRGINYEGGLFRYRYIVYAISFLLPVLLASLAFIGGTGYVPLTNWCYIPSHPIWYRLALSWGPRYVIIVSIFIIYGCIYRHISNEYSKVGNIMMETEGMAVKKQSLWKRIYNLVYHKTDISDSGDTLEKISESYLKRNSDETSSMRDAASHTDDRRRSDKNISINTGSGISAIHPQVQKNLNEERLVQFKHRKGEAEKQMKALFIYPVSYIFLWIATLIVHAWDFRYGTTRPPVIWLNSIAAFMQPFNCTIDTLVFLYKERPWKLTTIRTYDTTDTTYEFSAWRRSISFLPLFALPDLSGNNDKPNMTLEAKSFSNNNNLHDFSAILSDADNDFISRGNKMNKVASKSERNLPNDRNAALPKDQNEDKINGGIIPSEWPNDRVNTYGPLITPNTDTSSEEFLKFKDILKMGP